MDYNEVLQRARERIGPKCKVCPECNGLGCGNTMPGPGSKAPGNGANDNWRAWRRWSLNMDTIAPNTPVDTSLALFGRTFSLPVIAAPIGSLRAQFNPGDDIRDYNACAAAAAAQTGIAASFGDGLDARVFPHGCALSKQYGGIVLPVINPLSMDTIRANLDLANAADPFAVSVVIDSAGLPHLKAASPDAGSKTVAELRELCDYAQAPMILKGIMTVRGAQKAVEAGAAGLADKGVEAAEPPASSLARNIARGWERLLANIGLRPGPALPADRNVLHFDGEVQALRSRSAVAADEARRQAAPTSTQPREDPSCGDTVRSANERAYAEDARRKRN